MADILLKRDSQLAATYVPNIFIDQYMTNADGEFVKIYLYLLRCINCPDMPFSISDVADKFDYTEKDVKRALKYWEKMHLLRLKFTPQNELSEICLMDFWQTASKTGYSDNKMDMSVSVFTDFNNDSGQTGYSADSSRPAYADIPNGCCTVDSSRPAYADIPNGCRTVDSSQPAYADIPNGCRTVDSSQPAYADIPNGCCTVLSVAPAKAPAPAPEAACVPATQPLFHEEHTDRQLAQMEPDETLQELLYVAERYFGRHLKHAETEAITYWLDKLKLSQDLIDYLIEQCVAKNHANIQYMDKIALDWANNGIHTLSEAKQTFAEHNRSVYAVKKAFGITNRNLADFERDYVQSWSDTMGFSDEVIALACQKTLRSTQQINFTYANSILQRWQKEQLHNTKEIEAADDKYKKLQAKKFVTAKKAAMQTSAHKSKDPAKYSYNNFTQRTYDYDALERELLASIK